MFANVLRSQSQRLSMLVRAAPLSRSVPSYASRTATRLVFASRTFSTTLAAREFEREDGSGYSARDVDSHSESPRRPWKKEFVDPSNQLYVGNLPWSTTEPDLRDLFGEFGEVESVRLHTLPDGRSKGFAHVTFSSSTAAAEAKSSADEEPIYFGGRDLVINFSRGAKPTEGAAANTSKKLYFANYHGGESGLRDLLKEEGLEGSIVDVYFLKDRESGETLPRAFVEFVTLEEANSALKALAGREIEGNRLFAAPAKPKVVRKPKYIGDGWKQKRGSGGSRGSRDSYDY